MGGIRDEWEREIRENQYDVERKMVEEGKAKLGVGKRERRK